MVPDFDELRKTHCTIYGKLCTIFSLLHYFYLDILYVVLCTIFSIVYLIFNYLDCL